MLRGKEALEINGEVLTMSEVRSRAAVLRRERQAPEQAHTLEDRLKLQDEALELLIDRRLLVQEACRLQLAPSESEVDAVLKQTAARYDGLEGCRAGADSPEARGDLRDRITVDRLLVHWRGAVRRPVPEEVRTYYLKNKQRFYAPEQVHASHVVRPLQPGQDSEPERTFAEQLRERVIAGEDFAQIATAHSGCPDNAGDLGWFARGVMVSEFETAIFATAAGQLTPVFQTVFGFHFALVHAHRKAGIPPLDEIRQPVEEAIWLAKRERYAEQQLTRLRERATIRRL